MPKVKKVRLFCRRDDEVRIAKNGEWDLVELKKSSGPKWLSLKLYRLAKPGVKRTFYIGWNGERIARNHDVANLAENHPAALAWVQSVLGEWR